MDKIWHYSDGGERHGPVGSPELKQLAAQGVIRPETLVWKDGMSEWVRVSRVKGLLPEAASSPPNVSTSGPPPLPGSGGPPPLPQRAAVPSAPPLPSSPPSTPIEIEVGPPTAATAPLANAKEWYYLEGQGRSGPVDFETLKHLASSGGLTPQDQVWKTGMASWAQASTVGGLLFSEAAVRAANEATLDVVWPGKWMLGDINVKVFLDGDHIGGGSFKDGFTASTSVPRGRYELKVKLPIRGAKKYSLDLTMAGRYEVILKHSQISGNFEGSCLLSRIDG